MIVTYMYMTEMYGLKTRTLPPSWLEMMPQNEWQIKANFWLLKTNRLSDSSPSQQGLLLRGVAEWLAGLAHA